MFENAGGDVCGHLELEHHHLALFIDVVDLVVAQGIAVNVGVRDLFAPLVTVHDPQFLEHVAALLEVLNTRQFEPPFQHVLAGDANLKAAGAQPLVHRAHVKQDDIGIDATAEPGRVPQALIALIGPVDADEDSKAVLARLDLGGRHPRSPIPINHIRLPTVASIA